MRETILEDEERSELPFRQSKSYHLIPMSPTDPDWEVYLLWLKIYAETESKGGDLMRVMEQGEVLYGKGRVEYGLELIRSYNSGLQGNAPLKRKSSDSSISSDARSEGSSKRWRSQ
jgi:hypothetical protein